MTLTDLRSKMELTDGQAKLAERLLDIAADNGIEINSLSDLMDVVNYIQDNKSDFSDINQMQLGVFESRLKEANKKAKSKKTIQDKVVGDTARAVAKTTAGTVGRQLGKEAGQLLGGSFGKTLGGNVGAELGRKLVDVVPK